MKEECGRHELASDRKGASARQQLAEHLFLLSRLCASAYVCVAVMTDGSVGSDVVVMNE